MTAPSPHDVRPEQLPIDFGRYRLMRLLGEGGMGRVFSGELSGPGGFRKQVAVKVIRARQSAEDSGVQEDFLREARIMGLLRHPNLVDCYDFGYQDGCPFIAMELIDGRSLAQLLKDRGRLPVTVALDLGTQLCAGLRHAHSLDVEDKRSGLVHRDLKPANLLVTDLGIVKVLDFGLADAASRVGAQGGVETTAGVEVRGTPAYMSPEQVRGAGLDSRSDIFAVGLILFEAVTGERFFLAENPLALLLAVVQVAEHADRIGLADAYLPGLSSVIGRCLQERPEGRFARVGELSEALLHLLRSLPPGPDLRSYVAGLSSAGQAEGQTTLDWEAETVRDLSKQSPAGSSTRDSMGTQGSRASALAVRRTNLPSESSSFVGRQKSLLALEEQVEPGFVVSIIGTGGTGKSRLAVHYGVRELGRWLAFGGVWFCPLVEARSVEDMVAQVARVLDVSLEGLDSDLEDAAVLRIGWALAGRGQVLLILDNFEQLDASASKVLGLWLDLASELSLIVTSREALRIPRERLLRLEPLDEEDAVQLFEDRGRSVRPDLALNEADLSVVRQIVARVDRIPLAVELAAARVAILPPQKILERLSQRFRLLRGRAEGRGTLEGTIAWSWDLLKPYEQEAMWQCTAFRGGFRLEAAEEVLDLSRHEGDPWVLDVLEALREKSLLTFGRQIDRTDEARFVILESIREYAASKAPPGGSWEAVLARHAQSTLAHAEEKAQLWEGRGDVGALAELSLEQENLLAVHERGLTAGSAEAARAATALVPVLRHTRPLQEFSSFLEAVEVASRGTEPAVRARLLFVAASTTLTTRTIEANLDLLGEAVREALSAGDRRTACQALCFGSQQLLLWGRTAEAGDHYERAHELSEALNDPTLQPYVTRTEAMLASETDTDASAQLHRAALRQWEALGHRPGACREQNYLAILAVEREDYAEAERLFRKALRGLQKMGSRRTAQMLSANLGLVQAQLGQFDDSRKTLRTTIEEARALGSRLVETLSLNSLLELEIVTGRVERAGELADRVARMLDATFPPNIQVVLRIGQASAFRACGRLSEALSEAEEAVRQAEDEPDQRSLPRARAVLAMCLSKIGKFEEARVQMRTARSDQKSDELSQAERYFYEAAELSLDLLGAEQDPEDCAGKVAAVLASSAEQVVAWEKHVEGVCDLGIRTQLALASSEVRRLGGEASA